MNLKESFAYRQFLAENLKAIQSMDLIGENDE